jgi:NADH-quinone oxidoreductase subunit I
MSRIAQTLRGAALMDFWGAFALGMRYFFRKKPTINYPFEKGRLSPRFRGSARPAPLCEWRRALHRLQAV